MSLFRRKKSLTINKKETTHRVRYLGNVQTTMMKGDGCVDRPTAALWNNYIKTSNPGLEMKLNVVNSGLKVNTKQQGVTEYWANRITYCIAHPKYPKLFVWVYRHEGKKLKSEIRCHAALCHSEKRAHQIAELLQERISVALQEFLREKTRRQNSRITLEKTSSWSSSTNSQPLRKKLLSPASYFKPPVERSSSAPKLCNITETDEGRFDSVESLGAHLQYYGANMDALIEEDESSGSDLDSPFSSSPDHKGSQGRSDTDDLVTLTDRLDTNGDTQFDHLPGGEEDEVLKVELVVMGEDPGQAPTVDYSENHVEQAVPDESSVENVFFENDTTDNGAVHASDLSTIKEQSSPGTNEGDSSPCGTAALRSVEPVWNNNDNETREEVKSRELPKDKEVVIINNTVSSNGTSHVVR